MLLAGQALLAGQSGTWWIGGACWTGVLLGPACAPAEDTCTGAACHWSWRCFAQEPLVLEALARSCYGTFLDWCYRCWSNLHRYHRRRCRHFYLCFLTSFPVLFSALGSGFASALGSGLTSALGCDLCVVFGFWFSVSSTGISAGHPAIVCRKCHASRLFLSVAGIRQCRCFLFQKTFPLRPPILLARVAGKFRIRGTTARLYRAEARALCRMFFGPAINEPIR